MYEWATVIILPARGYAVIGALGIAESCLGSGKNSRVMALSGMVSYQIQYVTNCKS